MLAMMRRPRWVAALVLALGVAAAFALLGQWQMDRAIEAGTAVEAPTEHPLPLNQVVEPDGPTEQVATGQTVEVEGVWVPGDSVLIEGRLNGGVSGFWVVAHLTEAETGAGLPVALGWSADPADARAAIDRFDASADGQLVSFRGRFLPSEAPIVPEPGEDPQRMKTVAVAQLINVWSGLDDSPVYFGYVVAFEAPVGLEAIDSPPPQQDVELNWLNVFYAVEWVAFAGFAIFLWYRLVRDAWEREQEERAEAEADAGAARASTDAP